MRLSASSRAVSIRIGTLEDVRRSRAKSKPVSPGIITSRISRSKRRPVELGARLGRGLRGGDAIAFGQQEARQQVADAAVVVDHEQMRRVVGERGDSGLDRRSCIASQRASGSLAAARGRRAR